MSGGLLTEEDADVIAEHLDSCPRCVVFNDQLDETIRVLELLPLPEPPPAASDALRDHTAAGDDVATTLQRLCRLAASLDPEQADDLVQETLLEALQQHPAAIDLPDLARRLTDRVVGSQSVRTVSTFDQAPPPADPDSDTGELFYPEFYEEGPDAGRFVAQPNTWGLVPILGPDEDVETGELLDVVESALNDLPAPDRLLVELVDVSGVPLADAAAALRLEVTEAAAPLARGRLHVRGALDRYLTSV